MSDSDGKSTSVVFLCGGGSDGRIGLCDSTLFEKAVHEVATNGDDLIALCHDGCYNLSTGLLVNGCGFKASHFCAGMKATYALSCDGSLVYSWGEGSYGELGLGLCKTRVQEPAPVKHKSSFNSISCGEHHCVVLDITGNAYSWGQNFDRQLGLYSNDSSKFKSPNYMVEEVMFVPSLLPFSLRYPVKKVSCGARFTVAIGMNGDLWSWGAGECGQLGTGICKKKEAPSKVLIYAPLSSIHEDSDVIVMNGIEEKNIVKVADVACGDSHVLAVGNDGSTYVWGLNNRGQLGVGDTDSRSFPSLIPSFTCSKVYASGLSSAGISAEGDLYTWGSGSKFRLMHQTEQGDDRLGDNAHKLTPTFVDALYGNIVKSFAFSLNGSAALVITRLYELTPPIGPQKHFNEIQIHGCGFWNSDRIIVKFQKIQSTYVDPLDAGSVPIPRSAVGRLTSPGVISCRPPRLAESGEYEVTVSLDGERFVKDALLLNIYPDVTVRSVYPKFLDVRSTDITHITMTLGGFTSPPSDEESEYYDVKLVFKPLLDTGSDKNTMDGVQEFMVRGVLSRDLRDADEVGAQLMTDLKYRVVCEVTDVLSAIPLSKLYSLQARISLNGFDFNELKKDSECTILCHSFNPLSISPNSCRSPLPWPLTPATSTLSNNVNDVSLTQSSRAAMKEVCVAGVSFLPSRYLPANFTVQAVVTAIFSIPQYIDDAETKEEVNSSSVLVERATTATGSTGYTGVNAVSIVVPVRCTSQTQMHFTPPILHDLISLLDKKQNDDEYSTIKATVQFQLVSKVNAAAMTTAGSSPRTYQSSTDAVKQGNNIQWLCPHMSGQEDLVLHLFTIQAITITPAVTRRLGGTAHTVQGAVQGGYKCCPYPDLVRVLLKAVGDTEEMLLDPPVVTVHKERTAAVIAPVLEQDVAELSGLVQMDLNMRNEEVKEESSLSKIFKADDNISPAKSFSHLIDMDVEYKYRFVMPNTCVQQGNSKPLQYVTASLLLEDDSDTSSVPSFNISLFDAVKIGAVVNPKGGHSQGSQVTVAVTGIPECVKSCIVHIRGVDKDKNAMGTIPVASLLWVEILEVQVRDGNQEITFTLSDLSLFQILTPVMVKKAKMYFVCISIDGGSSFDSSATAVLQLQ